MKDKFNITHPETYRAIDIIMPINIIKEYGLLKTIWGTDIFINNVPVIKAFALANIIAWIVIALKLK